MVERRGDVLYWTGACSSYSCGGTLRARRCRQRQTRLVDLWRQLEAAYSAGCWVLGRALRYILAGR